MSDYNYLSASDGTGDASLMHLTSNRSIGSTVYNVDSIVGVPANFIATCGTLLASGFIDPTTKTDFKGHVSGATLVIDGFEPGSTDVGNTSGQVVVIKPTTGWANRVAQFVKNATGFGTPENLSAATLTALGLITATNGINITGGLLQFNGVGIGTIQSWIPALAGFSSTSVNEWHYFQIGNIVFVNFAVMGVYNGSAMAFTPPTAIDNGNYYENAVGLFFDNTASITTAGRIFSTEAGQFDLESYSTLTVGHTYSVRGQIWYQV